MSFTGFTLIALWAGIGLAAANRHSTNWCQWLLLIVFGPLFLLTERN